MYSLFDGFMGHKSEPRNVYKPATESYDAVALFSIQKKKKKIYVFLFLVNHLQTTRNRYQIRQ